MTTPPSVPPRLSTIQLLLLFRDAHTKLRGLQHLILMHLILRVRPETKYSCFPSMATLAMDCGDYDVESVGKAVAALETGGYVRREVEKRFFQGQWQTRIYFFVNVQRLLALKNENEGFSEVPKGDPFSVGLLGSPDPGEDAPDEPDVEEGFGEGQVLRCETLDELVEVVRKCWPEHSAFADAQKEASLRVSLAECAKIAGSMPRCGQLILISESDPATKALVRDATNLGRYLLGSMRDWLTKHAEWLNPVPEMESE